MAGPSTGSIFVIVESLTKVATIGRMLPGYLVMASIGHVRDLPNSAEDIPAALKKEGWARDGVNVENDFEPLYIISNAKTVSKLRPAVKQANRIYFATDGDREGESISWHLLKVLNPKVPYSRLVFNEITKEAIRNALESPRPFNLHLVEAQETRRIVDRLFGYKLSPLLWKKMARGLSAGRVQSVAVRLLVERERERMRFTAAAFWGMKARFAKPGAEFEANLVELDGKRVVIAKDFDPDTGELKPLARGAGGPLLLLEEGRAQQVAGAVRRGDASVASVVEKPFQKTPKPPYVTSTLQQEANAKLGFSARHTMSLAQQLYQNGFITFMRTDSTMLSEEAKSAARKVIVDQFGEKYLSKKVRFYRNQVKNAQEAHEAIRPAGGQFRAAAEVGKQLGAEAAKLYEMIWRRTLASQMPDARGTYATIHIDVGEARFRATGWTIDFEGYLKAYPDELKKAYVKTLPQLAEGDGLEVATVDESEHSTQPPRRYTEGSLIQKLEGLGIGRPSTWATIVDRVQDRDYAFKRDRALVPTFTALAVVSLLEEHFRHLVDYEFTAGLEDQFDAIARGGMERLEVLNRFYFGDRGQAGLKELIEAGERSIDHRKVRRLPIGTDPYGKALEVCIGRFGPFLSDGDSTGNIPEDLAPDELDVAKARELIDRDVEGPKLLGIDPASPLPVFLKNGRFGWYVQLGDDGSAEKPKRANLLKEMDPESVDLNTALKLLALPRILGRHPATDEDVIAANGRYGPYVKCGKESRTFQSGASPLDITLGEALELLAQERRGRRRGASREPLKLLGKHPQTGKDLKILAGRYGPYVTDGETNAALPRDAAPDGITMEQAVNLLQARADRIAAYGGAKPRRRGERAPRRSAA